jgi:hypothetical protein
MIEEDSRPMKDRFPRLHSYALNDNLSAAQVYFSTDLLDLFFLPLSNQAHQEFLLLQDLMMEHTPSDQNDVWSYCWGGPYKAAKFYDHIHSHIQVPGVYKWLWKSSCIMRTKVFAWLLLSDRLNTRDMLQRRHWRVTNDTHCELCLLDAYEDRSHLFFECNFSMRIWNYLQITWVSNDNLQAVVSAARRSFGHPFFMEVLITACWNIWLIRNAKIFRQERPTFAKWKCKFVHDLTLLQHRIKAKYKDRLLEWIAALP